MMQKGRIIVCGDVGQAAGDSMYEGSIYVGGKIGSLGADAKIEEVSEEDLIEIWDILESHGIDERPRFTKIVSEKKLYHYDALERLEKTVI
jgi:glutamate synthase domain-containing protein 3